MNEPWRIAAAVVLLVALAGALVWALRDSDSNGAGTDGSAAKAGPSLPATTLAVGDPVAATSLPSGSTTIAVPLTTVPFTTLPPVIVTAPPPPVELALADVLPAVEDALAAWGEFAVTGDLELVEATFDVDGPQYAQLRGEAPTLEADPLGPPPYVFTLSEPSLRRPDPEQAVVIADVTLERPGEPTQVFRWRIVMRWTRGEWLLWTVRDEGG